MAALSSSVAYQYGHRFYHRKQRHPFPFRCSDFLTVSFPPSSFPSVCLNRRFRSYSIHIDNSFLGFSSTPNRLLRRFRAGSPGPPPSPPPQSDPSGEEKLAHYKGFTTGLSRFWDNTLQIFMAVLFWMSLFFWASAWDGRNGRRNKGNRRRK